jgi:hypothetical protein
MDDFCRALGQQGLRVKQDGMELTFTPVTTFQNTMSKDELDPALWLIQVPDGESVRYTVTLANITTGETCIQRAACVAKREVHRVGHLLFFDVYTSQDKLCRIQFGDNMRLDVSASWVTKKQEDCTQTIVSGLFSVGDDDTCMGSPGWSIYVSDRVFVHVGAMKVCGPNGDVNMFVSSVSVTAPLLENPYDAAA